MAGYAPPAIVGCWTTVKAAIPSAQLGGVFARKPGYHNARSQVHRSDYSVQRADDRVGDINAASALDITLPDAQMRLVTSRLMQAAGWTLRGGAWVKTGRPDPRLKAVREFFGTTNSRTVVGSNLPDQYLVTSDPSHLWHIHISGYRRWATDHAAWQQIASVIVGTSGGGGGGTTTPGKDWFEMATQAQLEASIRKVMETYLGAGVMGQTFPMRTRRMANRILALVPVGDAEKDPRQGGPDRNELFDALAKRIGVPDIVARLERIEQKIK